jgi:hypothetical protein
VREELLATLGGTLSDADLQTARARGRALDLDAAATLLREPRPTAA